MPPRNGEGGFLKWGTWKRRQLPLIPDSLTISSVVTASLNNNSIFIPMTVTQKERNVETQALLDSGAQGEFMDEEYAKELKVVVKPLTTPIKVRNADGTKNQSGEIKSYTWIKTRIGGEPLEIRFLITKLPDSKLILGLPWLKEHNPDINWETGQIKIDPEKRTRRFSRTMRQALEIREFRLKNYQETPVMAIRTKTTMSQTLSHQNLEVDKKTQERTIEDMVPGQYLEYRRVFEKEASQRLPERRPWDHAIELKEGFQPRDCKIIPLSAIETEKMNRFIDEHLEKGYIRPSKSEQVSPFFFVSKKDSKELRPVQDYRKLNEGTKKNRYPLPLITDLLDKLKGKNIFTKLDVRWGYNNVRIKEGDEWKAAFKTSRGVFEPTVMFFGLCNSPATFQSMMNDIFKDMIAEGWLVIYIDDLMIASENQEQQDERTRRVLERLMENDLYLKAEKCAFNQEKVEYLGFVISKDKIAMDPIKLDGIAKWPMPRKPRDVRSFLGFTGYYRKFIRRYSEIAKPLNSLTKKNLKWYWTEVEQKAFEDLKERFLKKPVLIMPDPGKPFQVETDASKWATGGVLRQQDSNGDWHPCGFISHTLTPTERNYEIYDRELLAIITALKTWRHYLIGSPHPIVVRSDHKNLTYFRTAQKLNRRQARWSIMLSEYDLQLVHVPGSQMVQSDALSRRPDHIPEEDTDNEDTILLPTQLFARVINLDLRGKIMTALTEEDRKESLNEDWKETDGLLFYKGRCFVPDQLELRKEIVHLHHDTLSSGHPGVTKTLELIKRQYFWPGMARFVKNYVSGCPTCQQMKVITHPTVPGLNPIPTDEGTLPFKKISTDFIVELPEDDGFNSIMVMVDHGLTKGVILCPCRTNINATETAELILTHLYPRFGLPDSVISDRGTQFTSRVFQAITKQLGIKSKLSTAYHPQTDGETERVNQELGTYLRIFCSNNPNDWVKKLKTAEFAHNSRPHSVHKNSPFFLMMGYEPQGITGPFTETTIPSVEKRLNDLEEARKEAIAAHDLARQLVTERIKKISRPFKEGEKVWLEATHLKRGYPSKKLAPKREGPFKIKEVLGPVTYRLKLPQTWKIHDVFHATLLTPYEENETYGKKAIPSPPDVDEEGEHYEVEAIINHRTYRGYDQYLIKWKDFDSSENTWEPEHHLTRARRTALLLNQYKRRHRL